MTSLESMKRYWKRKQYQRLNDTTNRKRKLRIARLGSQRQQVVNFNETTKVMLKFFSPIKFFSKFRNGLIVCLSSNNDKKLLQDKPDFSRKGQAVPMVSGTNNEVVDARLILEIYKRLVASGEVARLLV
ncbi:Transcriptional repressor NrdR like [Heracleum sosnowskyi]|uniref:Transcriptional repressor NrdR like n=1 Tax=Heracleum sosnowskyi TaxID=360622 RepID=A0AAD8IRW3_9APIA|nr:Transcriptional repressor NrdR like [Heracleum sosnowskyi]